MTVREATLRTKDSFLLRVMFMCLMLMPFPTARALGAESIDECGQAELESYLALARAAEAAYDDSLPGLERTPSGCVALVREDADGNLVVAFRGSLLGDRNPKHRFSNLGGENVRRNYRDWVATNLKQTAGFLPRQYVEAAAVVEKHIREHPADKLVYITGHSKGGGAAVYAYIAAAVSPHVSKTLARRMRCVAFNAAVVRERNWRRLFRELGGDADRAERELRSGTVFSLVMADDPVSKIAASEERRYVKRIYITPAAGLTPTEQHGIQAVIRELEKRVAR